MLFCPSPRNSHEDFNSDKITSYTLIFNNMEVTTTSTMAPLFGQCLELLSEIQTRTSLPPGIHPPPIQHTSGTQPNLPWNVSIQLHFWQFILSIKRVLSQPAGYHTWFCRGFNIQSCLNHGRAFNQTRAMHLLHHFVGYCQSILNITVALTQIGNPRGTQIDFL